MAFLVGIDEVIDNNKRLGNVGETVNNLGNTGTSATINLNNVTFVLKFQNLPRNHTHQHTIFNMFKLFNSSDV